ncbi:MAG: glycosyltransferase family 4 protein [bacterium]|nr:glycosyltransferase family 4 protein [bacterium]
MKKIWILNHYAKPPDKKSGSRHHDIARYLQKKGYRVTIFCAEVRRNDVSTIPSRLKFKQEKQAGVDCVILKTRPDYQGNGFKRALNMFFYYFAMVRHYRQFEKPDIVIGSSVHIFAAAAAAKIARRTGAVFISEIRDIWSEGLVQVGGLSRLHPFVLLVRAVERKVYRESRKIIVVLPNAYEHIKEFGVEKDKILYIPNGVDLQKFDKDRETKRPSDGLAAVLESGFCCVYAGAHGVANNLDTIISAAEIVGKSAPRITFVFIGDGPKKAVMQGMVKEKGLANVSFLAPVSKREIPAILVKASVSLLAMPDVDLYRYGISLNKLFDYMASGTPVVFAGKVFNDLVAESGCGISVLPERPDKFAGAILELYNMSEKERAEMGKKGRRYVEENHNIETLVEKLTAIL